MLTYLFTYVDTNMSSVQNIQLSNSHTYIYLPTVCTRLQYIPKLRRVETC
jgi:hypothetical protein